jgi:hypothetical protein
MTGIAAQKLNQAKRIPSIDFWRGFYLLMIYINHIPDNLLSMLTLRNWGFADSAEVFVFISGFSAMLAFGRYFDAGGMTVGLLRTAKRAWQLFCAHLLLVFAMSAIIAIAGDFTDGKSIMERFNFSPFFVETDVAVVRLLKLGYMPNMTDILPLYIVLVLLFPVAWFLAKKSSMAALGASGLLWFWVTATGQSFANYPEGVTWFFNPLAWQFLFVAGMVAYKECERLHPLVRSKPLFWLSCFIVGISVLAIAPWAHVPVLKSWRIVPAEFLAIDSKANLSWVRIVHFFALAVIAARLFPTSSSLWNNKVVGAVSLCGRHSLAVYCTGAALSLVMHIVLQMNGSARSPEAVVLVLSGALFLVLLAAGLQKASGLLKGVNTKNGPVPRATGSPDRNATLNKEPAIEFAG